MQPLIVTLLIFSCLTKGIAELLEPLEDVTQSSSSYVRLLKSSPKEDVKTSEVPASLGSHLGNPRGKHFSFFTPNENFPQFNLCLLPLMQSRHTSEKSLAPSSPQPPKVAVTIALCCPLCPLFWRQEAPWQSWWPSTELPKVYRCLSCTGQPKTGRSILSAVSHLSWTESDIFSYNYVLAQNKTALRNNWEKKTTLTASLLSFIPWRPLKIRQLHQHCHSDFVTALPLRPWLFPLPTAPLPCASTFLCVVER